MPTTTTTVTSAAASGVTTTVTTTEATPEATVASVTVTPLEAELDSPSCDELWKVNITKIRFSAFYFSRIAYLLNPSQLPIRQNP